MTRKNLPTGGGLTVAERIVRTSLRSLGAEERGPVERTIHLLAVFWGRVPMFQVIICLDRTSPDESISDGVSRKDMALIESCSWTRDFLSS